MRIAEILTIFLKGKKIKSDVEVYDSIICKTHYPKDELVLITGVDLSSIEAEIAIYGEIIGGENAGQTCNIYTSLDKEFDFID